MKFTIHDQFRELFSIDWNIFEIVCLVLSFNLFNLLFHYVLFVSKYINIFGLKDIEIRLRKMPSPRTYI